MLAVNTPYLHVQAIRRMYQDQGKPTFAKPYLYPQIVNFTGTGATERKTEALQIDNDSDFVWLSVYHYFQSAIYDPAAGSTAAFDFSGQFIDTGGGNLIELRFTVLRNNRPLHNVDFISDSFTDGPMIAAGGVALFANEGELGGPVAAHPSEREEAVATGIWRGWLAAPIVLEANDQVEIGIRRRAAPATSLQRGHVFLLSGVRLFPGRSHV